MIWLITLFLVAVAYYLIKQGMAERALVKESTDVTTEKDDDLFMNISNRIAPEPFDGDVTIAEDNSKFAKAVKRFQEKSAKSSDKIEQKIAASKTASDDSFFDRSMAKISAVSDNADKKIEEKLASAKTRPVGTSIADDDSPMGRIVSKVNGTLKKGEEKLQARVERSTQSDVGKLSEETGIFSRAVNNVSSKLELIDKRVEDKLAASRVSATDGEALSSNEDFFSRVAGKVGDKVNSADDKLVDATRRMSGNAK